MFQSFIKGLYMCMKKNPEVYDQIVLTNTLITKPSLIKEYFQVYQKELGEGRSSQKVLEECIFGIFREEEQYDLDVTWH